MWWTKTTYGFWNISTFQRLSFSLCLIIIMFENIFNAFMFNELVSIATDKIILVNTFFLVSNTIQMTKCIFVYPSLYSDVWLFVLVPTTLSPNDQFYDYIIRFIMVTVAYFLRKINFCTKVICKTFRFNREKSNFYYLLLISNNLLPKSYLYGQRSPLK